MKYHTSINLKSSIPDAADTRANSKQLYCSINLCKKKEKHTKVVQIAGSCLPWRQIQC